MDYFALLAQPRRPWLDAESLKAAFLERSAREHPDRVHGAGEAERAAATARYAELNAAYNCLRDPKERLAHLLELEQERAPANVQSIPAATMDLFMKVGQLCREADRMLAAKPPATAALLHAQWFVESLQLTQKMAEAQQQIHWQREALLTELRAMNETWDGAPPANPERSAALPLGRLEEIYRIFSYTGRWMAQLQERSAQLSF